jgi:transcriptional regulator with XRE-family HTH domain
MASYNVDVAFATLLTDTMNARGLKDDDVAPLFGVKGPTVNRWRRGGMVPSDSKLPELAAWFELDEDFVARSMRVGRALLASGVEPLLRALSEAQAQIAELSRDQPKLALAAESGARSVPTPKRRNRPAPPVEIDYPENG